MVLYTDGVLDTESPDGNRFGLERLRGSIRGRSDSARSLVHRAVAAIESFRGGQPVTDDLTLVAIQLQPLPAVQPTPASDLSGSVVYGGPRPGARRAV